MEYPVGIPQSSLQAQLQALELLEAKVQGLTRRTSWDVQVPFAPKASAKGKLVHTNDLRVNVGAGVWIEMTALEAVEYLQRQRQRIIEQHMRTADRGVLQRLGSTTSQSVPLPSRKPQGEQAPAQGPSSSAQTPPPAVDSQAKVSVKTPVPQDVPEIKVSEPEVSTASATDAKAKTAAVPASSPNARTAAGSPNAGIIPSKDDLLALVEELAQQDKGPNSDSTEAQAQGQGQVLKDDTVLNEEGLPFLEIRETPAQFSDLSAEASASAQGFSAKAGVLKEREEREAYWSEAAKRRRAAVLKMVLGDDADEEDEVEETTETETPPSQPKSILKTPARKKSVSFETQAEASTSPPSPQAPDKPPATAPKNPAPPTAPFAGFKKGFLSSPLKQEIKPRIVELPATDPTPVAVSSASTAPSSFTDPVEEPAPAPAPKKKSLFAMRKAQLTAPKTEAPTLPEKTAGKPAPVQGNVPKLPKASTSKPMTSMKSSVVERAPERPAFKPAKPKVKPVKRDSDSESDGEASEYSDLESDEMDIDQALIARQIALDYHKRRSYIPVLNEEGTLGGDEWDRETGQGRWAEDREVRLGLPRLTGEDGQPIDVGASDLVHATELPAHLRVGKLENGQLIVAAGNDSDDSEVEEDEDLQRQREHKRMLLEADGLKIPGQKGISAEEIRLGMQAELEKLKPYLAKQGTGPKASSAPAREPESTSATVPASTPMDAAASASVMPPVAAIPKPAAAPIVRDIIVDRPTAPGASAVAEPSIEAPSTESTEPSPAPAKKVSKFKLARAAAANQ